MDAAGFFGADQLRTLGGDIEPWCAWVVARVMAEEHRLMPLADGHPYVPHDGFF